MKTLISVLLLCSPIAFACESPFPLEGVATIAGCDSAKSDCVSGHQAANEYFGAADDDDTLLSISLQSSPWRLYGPDLRIITSDEMAAMVKPTLADGRIRRIVLVASWTGVGPAGGTSQAAQLSRELDGFPVEGMDGFLWVDKNGDTRTTQQAYSVRAGGGYYQIERGTEVFVPMIYGWASGRKQEIAENRDGEVMLMAGVGDDAFMLCPDSAIAAFEQAADFGNAIGAYNAALMRLERGERDAAIALLRRAVALGDGKAGTKLAELES